MRTPQIRHWVLTNFGCRVLNFQILRMSVQGDLTPSRSTNNTNTTAQTPSSGRTQSRGSDDPLTALKKGGLLLRNDDDDNLRELCCFFCPNYTWTGSKSEIRWDNLSRHVKKRHREDLAAVNKKIRNLQKKRKNIGKTSTPNEIVKEIKRWWKSRDRPGSLTSFFQKTDNFTLLIRRRTISAASKLGFDGCLSILSRIM